MFTSPPEKIKSIGDLIGLAFRLYRRHMGIFFRALLIPLLVMASGSLGIQWILNYGLPAKNSSSLNIGACILLIFISLVVVLIAKFVLTLRQLAFVRMSLGYSSDFNDACQVIRKRRWWILSVMILGYISFMIALFIAALMLAVSLFLPKLGLIGILVATVSFTIILISAVASLFIIYFASCMTLLVISCENCDFNSCISKGISFVVTNIGRTIAFASLLTLCISAISYPLSLPVVAISFMDTLHKGITTHDLLRSSYHLPLYLMIIGHFCESLVNLLIWPIMFLAFGYFYWDIGLRKEGLDIIRRIDKLEEQHSL